MEEMKNTLTDVKFSIGEAIGTSFKFILLNWHKLLVVLGIFAFFSFFNLFIGKILEGAQVLRIFFLFLSNVLFFIIGTSFLWNIISFSLNNLGKYFSEKKDEFLILKSYFQWNNYWRYLIFYILLSIVVAFVFILPPIVILLLIGFLLSFYLHFPLLYTIILLSILGGAYFLWISVRLMFLPYALGESISKKESVNIFDIITSSFKLTLWAFWKLLLLFIIVSIISVSVSVAVEFSQISLNVLSFFNNDLFKSFFFFVLISLVQALGYVFNSCFGFVSYAVGYHRIISNFTNPEIIKEKKANKITKSPEENSSVKRDSKRDAKKVQVKEKGKGKKNIEKE